MTVAWGSYSRYTKSRLAPTRVQGVETTARPDGYWRKRGDDTVLTALGRRCQLRHPWAYLAWALVRGYVAGPLVFLAVYLLGRAVDNWALAREAHLSQQFAEHYRWRRDRSK